MHAGATLFEDPREEALHGCSAFATDIIEDDRHEFPDHVGAQAQLGKWTRQTGEPPETLAAFAHHR